VGDLKLAIKLLVVEDDADQQDLIRETLEDHFGPGTVTAVSSVAAALALDASGFSLILTDYNLSDGCGMDLLDEVRRRCSTPVVMVTGENVARIAAEAVRHGATDYVVKTGDYLFTIPLVIEKNLAVANMVRENEKLKAQVERAMVELQLKNGQLEESLQRVERVAATDPLTGLYNRRHFSRVLDQLFAEAHRYDTELSCVMIDLDGYKQLNDTRGHQVGDALLVAAGKTIAANLRRSDVAARYGGDEFVLLLPHQPATEAASVVRRIRDEFFAASAALLERPGAGVRMSVGVGSLRPTRIASPDGLIAKADKALYRAKEAGRDRIAIADSDVILPGGGEANTPVVRPAA
jgi:two-component system cell cycle response regulator